jgi:putative transposase
MDAHTDPADYKQLKRWEATRAARALNSGCFNNRPFLKSERAIGWFLSSTRAALEKHKLHLWAYVIMPTHFHLLLFRPEEGSTMDRFSKSLKDSVAKKAVRWVKTNNPAGLRAMRDEQPNGQTTHRFWERGGGYDRVMFKARAIWNMIDYMHDNPVEAGLCESPESWRWSSAATYSTKVEGLLPLNLSRRPFRPRPS